MADIADNTPPGLDEFIGAQPQAAPATPQLAAGPTQQEAPTDDGAPAGLDEFIAPEAAQAKYGTTGQQVIAGLEGLAKGAAGPLATGLERLAGVPAEDIRGRAEANPVTHYGAEGAGLVGTALATMGLGSALAKTGEAVGVGAEALGLGKVGSAIAKGAVENLVYQAGDEASKMILKDPNQSAETAVADLGLAAAIGGGVGLISPLWHATMGNKTAGVLGALANKMGGIEGVVPDALQGTISKTGMELAPEIRAGLAKDPQIQEMFKTLEQSDTTAAGKELQKSYNTFRNDAGHAIISAFGKTPEEVGGDLSKYEAGKAAGNMLADEYKAQVSPLAEAFDNFKSRFKETELPKDQSLPGVDTNKFSIMTAENPLAKTMTAEKNAELMKSLYAELDQKGIPYKKITGSYGDTPENSVLIPHSATINEGTINGLGKKYGQEAVIHKLGGENKLQFVNFKNEGKYNSGEGLVKDPNLKENYSLLGGQKFRLNLDFNELKSNKLLHYSRSEQPLSEINPMFMGEGTKGAERSRSGRIPRSYYYEEYEAPESLVTQSAKNAHWVQKPDKILDLAEADALPIIEHVRAKNLPSDEFFNKLEEEVKARGYNGYRNSNSSMPGAVALFEKQPVLASEPVTHEHFQKLRDKFKPEAPVSAGGTVDKAIDKISKLAIDEGWAASPSSDIMKEVNRVTKELPLQKNLKNLSDYITQIGANTQADPLNGPLRRAGALMKNVLKDAEADVITAKLGEKEGPAAVEAFKQVRKDYAAQSQLKEALDSRLHIGGSTSGYSKFINEMAKTDGETLLRRLSGVGDADAISFLQKNYPKTAEIVKNYHIDDLLKHGADKAKPGMTINSEALLTKFNKMQPELKNFIAGPEAQGKITAVESLISEFNKLPHNFSNTGRTVDKLLQYIPGTVVGAAAMIHGSNPVTGALMGYLTKAISKDIPDAMRLGILKFLGSDKQINSKGFKAMVEYMNHTIKGENLLSKGAKNVFRAGSEVIPASQMPTEKDRNLIKKAITSMRNDPSKMLNVSGDVGHYMPDHSTAITQTAANAVKFLDSQRPDTDPKSPLDTKREPSSYEKAQYDRKLDIAQQPLMILKHIAEGTLTPEDVNVQKTLYPALYQRTVQKLTDELSKTVSKGLSVPYKTRMGLSLYTGQALDSTMTPAGIMAAQPKPQQAQPQTPTQPASNPKRSTASLNKIPGMYRTSTQSAEQDRAGRKTH